MFQLYGRNNPPILLLSWIEASDINTLFRTDHISSHAVLFRSAHDMTVPFAIIALES